MNRENVQPVIGIVLCVMFFFAYQQYMTKKYPRPTPETAPLVMEGSASQSPAAAPAGNDTLASGQVATDGVPVHEPKRLEDIGLTLENPDIALRFNQELGALASIRLKHYTQKIGDEEKIELLDGPMAIRGLPQANLKAQPALPDAERRGNVLVFSREMGPWKVDEEFALADSGYEMKIDLKFTNTTGAAQELNPTLWLGESIVIPTSSGPSFMPNSGAKPNKIIAFVGNKLESSDIKAHCTDATKTQVFAATSEKVGFAGIDTHYFLNVLRPNFDKVDFSATTELGNGSHCPLYIKLGQRYGSVPAGETVSLSFNSFFGPKDLKILEQADPGLKKAVDFGWFTFFAYPLLLAVKSIQKITNNYGIAIIVVTALLKLLFYPLTKAASVSMKRMQKLQPEMQRIREKFADEPQKQQQELMKFMGANKVNPAKGCLPILPQIPVFIAFYNVLSQTIELRHASFALWIHDLAAADPYYVSPILLGALMFAQQRLTPNPGMDKAQARIFMMMPIMMTVMMLSLPAGMVIYMITNTIISIAQQQWLNKKLA